MLQYLANGLCMGAVIATVGLGFGLIYNTTRVFHLAHGGVYALAGYTAWVALAFFGLPLGVAIFLALAVAALAGMLIDWAVYQPLAQRSASPAVVMISSVGVQIVLEHTLALAFGSQTQLLRASLVEAVGLGPINLTYIQMAQLAVGAALSLSFWLFLKRTRVGQLCRAVSDDETLSRVLGVRTTRVQLLVFAIGSVFAGVGSVLIALDIGLDPNVGFPAVLAASVACIIGGVRNFIAPAAGGFLLGVIQSLVVWQVSAQWKDSVTFGLLILFLLARRQGLFSTYKRAEEA